MKVHFIGRGVITLPRNRLAQAFVFLHTQRSTPEQRGCLTAARPQSSGRGAAQSHAHAADAWQQRTARSHPAGARALAKKPAHEQLELRAEGSAYLRVGEQLDQKRESCNLELALQCFISSPGETQPQGARPETAPGLIVPVRVSAANLRSPQTCGQDCAVMTCCCCCCCCRC